MTRATAVIEALGAQCARQPGSTVDHTFGPETDVYRVADKIFALLNTEGDGYITVKADPDDAAVLVEQHANIRPGYYMNKRHWVTVDLVAGTTAAEIAELIEDSYDLIVSSLTKARRAELEARADPS